MVKRWLWLSGLVAAVVLLAAAVAPRLASAQRTVDLLGGMCNPVALTYPDGTPVTTVAAGVAPAGSLDTIWKYLPAEGRWLGYMASAPPEVSDLQTVERLDAVFVCVNATSTITMPSIGGGG
jgi:hypothetical protein